MLIAVTLYQCHLHNFSLQAIYIVIYEKCDFINWPSFDVADYGANGQIPESTLVLFTWYN